MQMGFEDTLSLEAFVFKYTTTAAGSLWPWIAVLAAAFGLLSRLRISEKLASSSAAPVSINPSAQRVEPVSDKVPRPQPEPAEPAKPFDLTDAHVPRRQTEEPSTSIGGGEATKGRFTAYYYGAAADDIVDEDVDWDVAAAAADEEYRRVPAVRWWASDMGWYEQQDWNVINGSVVRLWDDVHRHRREPMTSLPRRVGIGIY